ncbi:MAG: hypothetical protein ACK2UM_16715 [Anaerolineales bacterium]
MTDQFSSLGWLLVGTIGLALLQRRLHQEIQAILFLITRRIDLALAIFAILFLPGVLLHELSHYLTARLLRVPVGRLSIIPQALPDGRLRLGYVETGQTDFLRDALIGAAPLVAGSVFIAYAGFAQLDFLAVWDQMASGDLSSITFALSQVVRQPDFWIWFYIIFVISSTMFPSATDRRAWGPVLLGLVLLLALVLIGGAGPWLWENLGAPLFNMVDLLSLIFILSALVHLILWPPSWLLRVFLERIFRLKVV